MNDSKQRTDAIDGLEEILNLVRRYTETEHIYFQDEDTTLKKDLEATIIKLYRQALEFEARTMCQFSRNFTCQFARNMVGADNWKIILSSIQVSETACNSILRLVDARDQRERLNRLDRCLGEQSRRVHELLQASQVQDEDYRKKHLAELHASREEHKEERMSDEQSKCIQSLRTTIYKHNKEKNKDPVEGTCKWFLEHWKYQEWLRK